MSSVEKTSVLRKCQVQRDEIRIRYSASHWEKQKRKIIVIWTNKLETNSRIKNGGHLTSKANENECSLRSREIISLWKWEVVWKTWHSFFILFPSIEEREKDQWGISLSSCICCLVSWTGSNVKKQIVRESGIVTRNWTSVIFFDRSHIPFF